LQRLYDVHHALEDPEDGPALVLIDEIDAHMHPAWQRTIAPTLKELFPDLQVLATTHSPMIVGTLSEGQNGRRS
jgi:predicted ATP-binding protein involved in virulence